MSKKRIAYRIILLIGLLMLGLASAVPIFASSSHEQAQIAAAQNTPTAVVATGALNVRSGPGVNFGVVEVSYRGHVVALLGRNSNSTWTKVRLFSGREGWVNAALIQSSVAIATLPVVDGSVAPPPPANATAVVAVDSLNVYAGPGESYGVVEVSHKGHVVALIGRNNNSTWVKVRLFSGREGWLIPAFVQANVAIASLPIVGAPPTLPPQASGATGIVATGRLNVRSGPGVNYGVLTVTTQGQVLALLGRNSNGTWARVRAPNGVEGWVNVALIQANVAIITLPEVGAPPPPVSQPAPPPATAVVWVSAANVRSGPGVGFNIVGAAYSGNVLTLLGRDSGSSWANVRLPDGRVGWINASLIHASVPIATLPIAGGQTGGGTASGLVITGALNVRYGPGLGYGIFSALYQGQRVALLCRNFNSTWVLVLLPNGQEGWVNASLIQANVPINTLPVAG